MSEKNLKITILTDKSSWMKDYNIVLKTELELLGHQVSIIHSKEEIEQGDIAFFLACFEIIEAEKLKLNNNNIVVHESDLPHGKGWSPATWQILDGKNIIPMTLFEADEKCDSGAYYIKDSFTLEGHELINEWRVKQGLKTVEMCLKFVNNYGLLSPVEQKGEECFYAKRSPKDSQLDINKSLQEQFNLLRTVDNENYPAFFEINGNKYIIKIYKDKS